MNISPSNSQTPSFLCGAPAKEPDASQLAPVAVCGLPAPLYYIVPRPPGHGSLGSQSPIPSELEQPPICLCSSHAEKSRAAGQKVEMWGEHDAVVEAPPPAPTRPSLSERDPPVTFSVTTDTGASEPTSFLFSVFMGAREAEKAHDKEGGEDRRVGQGSKGYPPNVVIWQWFRDFLAGDKKHRRRMVEREAALLKGTIARIGSGFSAAIAEAPAVAGDQWDEVMQDVVTYAMLQMPADQRETLLVQFARSGYLEHIKEHHPEMEWMVRVADRLATATYGDAVDQPIPPPWSLGQHEFFDECAMHAYWQDTAIRKMRCPRCDADLRERVDPRNMDHVLSCIERGMQCFSVRMHPAKLAGIRARIMKATKPEPVPFVEASFEESVRLLCDSEPEHLRENIEAFERLRMQRVEYEDKLNAELARRGESTDFYVDFGFLKKKCSPPVEDASYLSPMLCVSGEDAIARIFLPIKFDDERGPLFQHAIEDVADKLAIANRIGRDKPKEAEPVAEPKP